MRSLALPTAATVPIPSTCATTIGGCAFGRLFGSDSLDVEQDFVGYVLVNGLDHW